MVEVLHTLFYEPEFNKNLQFARAFSKKLENRRNFANFEHLNFYSKYHRLSSHYTPKISPTKITIYPQIFSEQSLAEKRKPSESKSGWQKFHFSVWQSLLFCSDLLELFVNERHKFRLRVNGLFGRKNLQIDRFHDR